MILHKQDSGEKWAESRHLSTICAYGACATLCDLRVVVVVFFS